MLADNGGKDKSVMSASVIFLILAIVFNAGANILMKAGVMAEPVKLSDGIIPFILSYITNFKLMSGIACFGIALVFYTKALEKFNLSIAYPMMTSCGLIIVTLWSLFMFHERLSAVQFGGLFMIIGGIWLLNIH
ncbi:small multidrug resistance protein [bacterium]|nr:small multidrug resistance protein [bacterium]